MKSLQKLFILVSLFMHCGNPFSSAPEPLDFSKMQINYKKSIGRGPSAYLNIDGHGNVEARVTYGDSVISAAKSIIPLNNQRKFSSLFSMFSQYKDYYDPEQQFTHGSRQTVELFYDGKWKKVSVYGLGRTKIPFGLLSIIKTLDGLLNKVTGF